MKSLIKTLLASIGLELRRTRPTIGTFPLDPYFAQKEFIEKLGVSDPVIFDIGAHMGETVNRYKGLFKDSSVYCFEPFPDNVRFLRSRYSSDPTIHVFDQAVSDSCGMKTFYVNENDATNSLLPRDKSGRRYYSKAAAAKTQLDIETITIDEVMKQHGIESVDILKLDIQGGELMALQGAEKALHQQRISILYSEALFVPHYENNPLLRDLWNYLQQFGYTIFNIYDLYRAANGQLRFADVIFVSKQVRSNVLDRYKAEP
jgi:FkbM family methyltransferase